MGGALVSQSLQNSKKWESYEQVAEYLLNQLAAEFGLEYVEGKQKVPGYRSGTKWVIDAKGVCPRGEGFIIVECRRYTASKQNQEKIGGLAYRITDTQAKGGILVSPLGLQEGALKIAEAENIVDVRLAANSTTTEFVISFLDKVMAGVKEGIHLSESVAAIIMRTCRSCGERFEVNNNEKVCPQCGQVPAQRKAN